MKSGPARAGALFALLILVTFLTLEGTSLGKKSGLVEAEPVLVFIIPNAEHARRVRAAIREDRILWQGKAGLALVGERVISSDLDGAGDVIERAGWIDHPIQIVRLDKLDRDATGSNPGAGLLPAERRARLLELAHKPTLTRTEQLFILQAMNEGIEL